MRATELTVAHLLEALDAPKEKRRAWHASRRHGDHQQPERRSPRKIGLALAVRVGCVRFVAELRNDFQPSSPLSVFFNETGSLHKYVTFNVHLSWAS